MSAWTFDYAMNQARLVLRDGGKLHGHEFVENVLTPLVAKLDEREKNPGVWDDAPDNAIIAKVHFYKADKVYARTDGIPTVYTRTLPKTKAREIAEKWACDASIHPDFIRMEKGRLADTIESAINEALAGGGK